MIIKIDVSDETYHILRYMACEDEDTLSVEEQAIQCLERDDWFQSASLYYEESLTCKNKDNCKKALHHHNYKD